MYFIDGILSLPRHLLPSNLHRGLFCPWTSTVQLNYSTCHDFAFSSLGSGFLQIQNANSRFIFSRETSKISWYSDQWSLLFYSAY